MRVWYPRSRRNQRSRSASRRTVTISFGVGITTLAAFQNCASVGWASARIPLRISAKNSLRAAIKELKQIEDIENAIREELHIDQDTHGMTGSPHLVRGPSTTCLQRWRNSSAGEGSVVGAPDGRFADRRAARISTYSGSAHRDLGRSPKVISLFGPR
jgi:hypothetical protein